MPNRKRTDQPGKMPDIVDQPDQEEMHDPMFDAMAEHWEHIVAGYKQFEDKRPIVLYDIQEKRVYLYPYEDFKNDMSPKSQVSLAEQYELAGKSGQMVMFVRDNDAENLVSFALDYK
jgi:hypothetical protein